MEPKSGDKVLPPPPLSLHIRWFKRRNAVVATVTAVQARVQQNTFQAT
jgi:hypothetical protein